MKLNYVCKHNGVLYPIGDDVPIGESDSPKAEVVETIVEPTPKAHTRSEIQLMKVDELRKLAESEGIDNASTTSGNQLKKILLGRFGL